MNDFLTMNDVVARVGVSRRTLQRWLAEELLPAPVIVRRKGLPTLGMWSPEAVLIALALKKLAGSGHSLEQVKQQLSHAGIVLNAASTPSETTTPQPLVAAGA